VTELPEASAIKLADRLRLSTVRACAALNLLERRFFEPPSDDGTTLTVVVQQVLSILKQRRGALFSQLLTLIRSVSAFDIVTEGMLREILGHLASPDEAFIEQASDGRYILTEKGEKLVHGPEFYAAFRTTDQWEIIAKEERKIGSISLSNQMRLGETFCLGGKRWEVTRLDLRHYRATVVPSLAGGIPLFDPTLVPEVHEQLALEMRRVLESDDVPADLDAMAAAHLRQGRSTYSQLGLARRALVQAGDLCYLLSWRGTRFNKVLVEVLRAKGFVSSADEVGVTIAAPDVSNLAAALSADLPSLKELSEHVGGILNGKYDRHIPQQLLKEYWSMRHGHLDADVREFCRSIPAESWAV
jgi:Lhr-like helicase